MNVICQNCGCPTADHPCPHVLVQRPASETEAGLRPEIERLKSALHADQTGLADAVARIHQTAVSYGWVAQGRGPYEWNDPEYHKEMGRMVTEIIKLATDALRESGDRAHVHCCGRKPQNNSQK